MGEGCEGGRKQIGICGGRNESTNKKEKQRDWRPVY